MDLIRTIVSTIQLHCQTKNIIAAVQDAVRLARLKSDIPTLVYFLLELRGPGNVGPDFDLEFPDINAEQRKEIFESALKRYFKARSVRPDEAASIGVGESAIFVYNSNQIDDEIGKHKLLLIEAKHKSESVLNREDQRLLWLETHNTLNHKLNSIERSKHNILNACFNYSSQIEAMEYASNSFARELTNLSDGISLFLLEYCPGAKPQFESILSEMSTKEPERRSHLLMSMRRIIDALADKFSPPQPKDGLGKNQTRNRLQYFLEQSIDSTGLPIDKTMMEATLKSVYDRANKGVHANVSVLELEQSVMHLIIYLNVLRSVTQSRTLRQA